MISDTDKKAMARRKRSNLKKKAKQEAAKKKKKQKREKRKTIQKSGPRVPGHKPPLKKTSCVSDDEMRVQLIKNYKRIMINFDLEWRCYHTFKAMVEELENGTEFSEDLIKEAFATTCTLLFESGLVEKTREVL